MDASEIFAKIFTIGEGIYNAERARRRNKQRSSELKEFSEKVVSASSGVAQTAPGGREMGKISHEPESPLISASEGTETHSKPPLAVMERKGLDPETMKWQLQQTRADLWELEGHLKSKCLSCGDPPTCCIKHAFNLIDIAHETKSMTAEPIWDDIIKLAEEVKVKCHPDAIKAKTYFAEFPSLAIRTSELRRVIEDKLIKLSKPEITLEEAKAEAAKLAEKEVEKLWESQAKT